MLKRFALIAMLLAIGACSSTTPAPQPLSVETLAPGITKKIIPVHLTMKLTGADSFDLDAKTKLVVTEQASSTPPALWFITISAPTDPPLSIGGGRQILFTADVAPGIYTGSPATYTLTDDPAKQPVLGVKSNIPSAAYIQLTKLTPPLASHAFGRFVEPCTLRLAKDQVSGRVSCPKLSDDEGNIVTLMWSWEMV